MAITPGTRIGPYQVTSQLGEGGMGVVFRASDTKLLRDVALKVLPDSFADDPDRLHRLQREAQLLASVNHPNIAQIYGLEQIGNTGCIVMELVEGETLAERLKNGPVPLDEALEIAKQIADALTAAHERGIVHRDLKPANIKLTPNGTVKVLDFGLAKALGRRSSETELSTLPTRVSGSVAGAVVGTVAYMSPEQARGKEVDARTDIWAFGCVLFEMLTARQTFGGETVTDMMAKIVTAEPDLNLLPPETPASIRLLLAATLNKNVQQRLQHIGDMRLFLDPKFFPAVAATAPVAVDRKGSRRRFWTVAIVAALTGALIAIVPALLRSPAAPSVAPEMRLEISLPDFQGFVSVSPDGQRVAYIARLDDGSRAIWVRPMASETAQKLAGTETPNGGLLWSPDGRYLAFMAGGKWKKIDVVRGGVQVISDVAQPPLGFSWNRDGIILFPKDNLIARVSDEGGEVTPVTALDQSKKETFHALPMFLPDGNHFLYAIISAVPENAGFFLGSLDGKVKQRLRPLPAANMNAWAFAPPGYLLLSTGTLTAQRFDVNRLTLEGQPVTIADGLQGGFSVSDTGLLIYQKGSTAPPARQLTWFDRTGRQLGQLGAAGNYGDLEISPKGDRVAVDIISDGNRDVWVIDAVRAVLSRVTFEPSGDWNPQWSPDGSRLVFASAKNNGPAHIYEKSSTGVGNDQLVFEEETEIPVDWSRNGRYIVFSRLKPKGSETWFLDTASGQKKALPFLQSPFDKAQAKLSPDGRWIAYTTNDSGMYQVVVQSFPDPTVGKWQITAQGGIEPKWSRDGRELYYLAFDGKLMAVSIKAGDRSLQAGTPVPLFETPLTVNRAQAPRTRFYDVAPDGRFLIAAPLGTATPPPVIAVVNWASGLENK